MKKLLLAFALAGATLAPSYTPAFAADGTEAPAVIPGPPPGQSQVIFWRPGTMIGGAMGCGVNMGMERISSLGSGKYFVVNLAPGTHEFNARSEARDALTLETESDETYYVRCTIRMGFMMGRPNLAPSDAAAFNEKRADLEYVNSDDHSAAVMPDPGAAGPPAAAAPTG
ncbi:MAG: DUF2846 domain-containing protein [Pseudomonadota bacterium]